MSGVPYTFGNATTTIALSNLDVNFATPVTIGNTTVGLGNTVTTLGNVTLTNPTITNPTVNTNLNFSSGTNGIVFNNSGATTNSTLNDYETGTWTPTLTNASSYSVQTGTYTKIGNKVIASCQITCAFTNSGSAQQSIGGLPFTSATASNPNYIGFFFPTSGFNFTSNLQVVAQMNNNATTATIYYSTASTSLNFNNAVSNQFGTSVSFQFSIAYTANF